MTEEFLNYIVTQIITREANGGVRPLFDFLEYRLSRRDCAAVVSEWASWPEKGANWQKKTTVREVEEFLSELFDKVEDKIREVAKRLAQYQSEKITAADAIEKMHLATKMREFEKEVQQREFETEKESGDLEQIRACLEGVVQGKFHLFADFNSEKGAKTFVLLAKFIGQHRELIQRNGELEGRVENLKRSKEIMKAKGTS
jgi:hypothetical protein